RTVERIVGGDQPDRGTGCPRDISHRRRTKHSGGPRGQTAVEPLDLYRRSLAGTDPQGSFGDLWRLPYLRAERMTDIRDTTGSVDGEHAERMDTMYRWQRHIYDLTRKYYLLGRDHAIHDLQVPPGGHLLEVGCGTGRNLLKARKLYPAAHLYGLDISSEMLASARKNFLGQPVAPLFVRADATHFSPAVFQASGFDRILLSYALSMIPDWEAAIDAAVSALAPHGSLHIIDFGQQEHLPHW